MSKFKDIDEQPQTRYRLYHGGNRFSPIGSAKDFNSLAMAKPTGVPGVSRQR
jgi:hypothetical protein